MRLTKEQKRDIDSAIGYNVGEGYLDDEVARKMTYKQKQEWLDKSEARAEAAFDQEREQEGEMGFNDWLLENDKY